MQIESLKDLGIVNDISDASFRPAKNITRAEFAMFLIRTLKLRAEVSVNDNFLDVSPDSEYAKELFVGKALGILNGIGDGKFAPLAEISRQDMMTIIARGMSLKDENFDLSQFSDHKDISDYAISGIKAMVSSKLVVGNADGTINPKGNATRAEAAVIMYRILNK